MVTRTDIYNKLATLEGSQMDKYSHIAEWLGEENITGEDKEKILDDLITYDNY